MHQLMEGDFYQPDDFCPYVLMVQDTRLRPSTTYSGGYAASKLRS
jgi:hypothetical protein